MKKDNKNDPALRQALYQCYKGNDAYTGQPLLFEEMQIDHIIPTWFRKTPDELKKIFKKLGLPPDFELDSIDNYLPTSGRNNRSKSGHEFSVHASLYYLELAKRNAPQVRIAIEEFKETKKVDKSLEVVKTSVYYGNHSPESVYNYLSEEKEDFPEQREMIRTPDSAVYLHSKKNVKMDGTLPTLGFSGWEGSCILTFRSLKLRDVTLKLNHDSLVRELFGALYTAPDLLNRSFIDAKHPEQDVFFIRIGNSRFPLQREEVVQLCEIVDDFAEEYIKAFQAAESALGAECFKRSRKYQTGYRLMKIKRVHWQKLIEFANEHDFDKGKSDWHIFDRNDYGVKVCTRESGDRYDEGYHVFLESEPTVEEIGEPTDSLWVVWEPVLEYDRITSFNDRQCWGVLTTYQWLINELLPQVSKRKSRKLLLSDGYRPLLQLEGVTSSSKLHEMIIRMQRFYYSPRRFLLERTELELLYSALVICLRRIKQMDLDYIAKKSRVRRTVTTVNELIHELERKRLEFADEELRDYSMTDNLFRALYVAIQKKPPLDSSEISEVVHCLAPFYEKMVQLATIERMTLHHES